MGDPVTMWAAGLTRGRYAGTHNEDAFCISEIGGSSYVEVLLPEQDLANPCAKHGDGVGDADPRLHDLPPMFSR